MKTRIYRVGQWRGDYSNWRNSKYIVPVPTVGEKFSSTVEETEFTGVNAVETAVHELPEFTGGVNATAEVPEYTGGANFVLAASNEVPEYTGGANFVLAAKWGSWIYRGAILSWQLQMTFLNIKGGVNGAEAAVHEVPSTRRSQTSLSSCRAEEGPAEVIFGKMLLIKHQHRKQNELQILEVKKTTHDSIGLWQVSYLSWH